jgi:hypothetical protein
MAGKLAGSGNGMQYFGAILIQSESGLDELEAYYSPFRKDEWSFIVKPQSSEQIAAIENRNVYFESLKNQTDLLNYFIVYTWGASNYPLSDLDLRGH